MEFLEHATRTARGPNRRARPTPYIFSNLMENDQTAGASTTAITMYQPFLCASVSTASASFSAASLSSDHTAVVAASVWS
jgi:hypothetical protein